KKNPRLSHIPVIIYTTSSHRKDIEETKQLGAAHFLIKPSSIASLTQILSGIFQQQSLPFSLNQEV
ncbi:MAG: response regulator, partial [Bacteroidota bacterium]|nr:response regulator [Bacteroidota bacterium]